MIALQHHLHELVLHSPSSVVRNAQVAMQFHRRNTFFVLGDQIDCLKPDRQWQLGGFKDGSGYHRGLPMTAIALLQLATGELTAPLVAAVRAAKSIRPSAGIQRIETLLFAAVLAQKFTQTETLLKLHLIARHSISSVRSTAYAV